MAKERIKESKNVNVCRGKQERESERSRQRQERKKESVRI